MYKILKDINEQINFTSVSINEIDETDRSFVFSYPERFEDPGIVDTVGVFEPMLFFKLENKFILIDGIKRYNAARIFNRKFINSMFITGGWWKDSDVFFYGILKNSLVRNLNIIEKANIIRKIYFENTFTKYRKKNSFLKLIEIENNSKLLKQYNELCCLNDGIKLFIVKRSLPLSTACIFTKFTKEEQKIISSLFLQLFPSVNKTRQFLEILFDLKMKNSIDVKKLFEKICIEEIINNEKTTNDQKTAQFEHLITLERHPEWSKSKKILVKKIGSLTKDTGINIKYDNFLESGTIKIDFDVKNMKDFNAKRNKLNSLPDNPSFSDIFKII